MSEEIGSHLPWEKAFLLKTLLSTRLLDKWNLGFKKRKKSKYECSPSSQEEDQQGTFCPCLWAYRFLCKKLHCFCGVLTVKYLQDFFFFLKIKLIKLFRGVWAKLMSEYQYFVFTFNDHMYNIVEPRTSCSEKSMVLLAPMSSEKLFDI